MDHIHHRNQTTKETTSNMEFTIKKIYINLYHTLARVQNIHGGEFTTIHNTLDPTIINYT